MDSNIYDHVPRELGSKVANLTSSTITISNTYGNTYDNAIASEMLKCSLEKCVRLS